jgi:bacillithiol biosynthesis deacetylase BshB2
MERHVLVVFPHPDDEAFGVSGTIALHTKAGTPVTYVCLTLGEMGRNMGNPFFANRETLPNIRKVELQAACEALDIQDLRMFGLRDKTVEFEDEVELTNRISAVIKELNPSKVITFYPGYSVHPDHDATGTAVIRAIKNLPVNERPTVHCIAFSKDCEKEIGEPDIHVDVTDVFETKAAAIKAHKTQTGWLVPQIENNETEVIERLSNERFWTYKF